MKPRSLALVLLLSLSSSLAAARPAPKKVAPQTLAQAKAAFAEATAAYDGGQFDVALRGFERAHELSRNPVLYFNMAACADKLGQTRVAAAYLRAYLTEVPSADDAAKVRERIGALEERAKHEDERRADEERRAEEDARRRKEDEERRAREPVASPPTTSSEPSVGRRYAGGFAMLGVTVAFGAVAAGLGGSAVAKYHSLDADCGATGCGSRVDGVRAQALAADVFLGLTGAAAVTTIVLFAIEARHRPAVRAQLRGGAL